MSRRFPIEPLEALFANSEEEVERAQFVSHRHDPNRVLVSVVAERLQLPKGTVHRYRRQGIPLRSADRIAIRAGFHPVEIWPDFHQE